MLTTAKRIKGFTLQSNGWRISAGFTLIEVMVTITVMAILLMIAVPSFLDVTLGSKLGAFANNFAASAHLARSEAIKRNAVVTLCVSSNGTSCAEGGWDQGWIVRAINGTVIYRQQALPTGFKGTESMGATSVAFQPSGVNATTVALTICRATPSVGSQERVVTITATARPVVTKTTTGTCT